MHSTRIFFLISLTLIIANYTFSQRNSEPCYFDLHTNTESREDAEVLIQQQVAILKSRVTRGADTARVIPVVVHIIHAGGTENISKAQILSQITVLNEDFRKITGTNGDGNGVDTQVEFCLAKIDPNGKCTDGIVRVFSSQTNHQSYQRLKLKELSFWDNTKYLNIYVVKTINGGVKGYSSFPGGPPNEDGIVVKHNYFGKSGTASGSGRVMTHEVGHWLGLYHTFHNGCGIDVCNDGDYVCDTPPQSSPNFNCTARNTCSNDTPNINDQKENYMDYTPDGCKDMFTNGQKLRMRATLDTIRNNIWSQSNLVSTGCDSSYVAPTTCGVAAYFTTLTKNICVGNTVDFVDISLNNATTWNWTFSGGTPAISTQQNPSVTYSSLGSFDVKLVVSDGTTTDSIILNNYITVTTPGIGVPLPYNENFDLGIFPPAGMSINNLDGGITWELDSSASLSGNYSAKINNYINTNYGSVDEIVIPYLDLSSNPDTTWLSFNWAYARSDPSFTDELSVLISTDCGTNFNQIFYAAGNFLATGPTQTTPYVPTNAEWKEAVIPLTNFASETYVRLKIVNVTDGGNNLFIDNINIGQRHVDIPELSVDNQFIMYPNPAQDLLSFQFIGNEKPMNVTLYNSIGEVVLNQEVNDENDLKILLENYSSGVYYVELKGDGFKQTKKLVISRN